MIVDTHVLLWAAFAPERLGQAAREALTAGDRLVVSLVSPLELGLKVASGKLDLRMPLEAFVEASLNRLRARWPPRLGPRGSRS